MDHAHISAMGQVACYLSHVELWKKCVELNETYNSPQKMIRYIVTNPCKTYYTRIKEFQ